MQLGELGQPLVLDIGRGHIERLRRRGRLLKGFLLGIREGRFHPLFGGQDGVAKPVRLQAGVGITEDRNVLQGLFRGRFFISVLPAGAKDERRQGA